MRVRVVPSGMRQLDNVTAIGIHNEDFRVTGGFASENYSLHVRRPARHLRGKGQMSDLAHVSAISFTRIDLHRANTVRLKHEHLPVSRELRIRIDYIGQA